VIPLGYMYKRVALRPEWLAAHAVEDVYSISACISANFVKDPDFRHCNGHGLFDSVAALDRLAAERGIDLTGMTLFYYEADEQQFDEETRLWAASAPSDRAPVSVAQTRPTRLEGYDVATFSASPMPECSPLSCNGLAHELPVNRHCLFDTYEAARAALDGGRFDKSEPGPFRIIAVHSLDRPSTTG
jgi:hypothetical protein